MTDTDNHVPTQEDVEHAKMQIQQAQERITELVGEFNQNKVMRNRARQLRTEAPGSFPCIRDRALPTSNNYQPYIRVKDLPEDIRRNHGEFIFSRVKNYLKILAAKSLFPRDNLAEQIIVDVNSQTHAVSSIQLVPRYLSRTPQPVQQIKDLMEELRYQEPINEEGDVVAYYFNTEVQQIQADLQLSDVAKIVNTIGDIDLVGDPSSIFINQQHVMST